MFRMDWRSKKTPKALISPGKTMPRYELLMPSFWALMYQGMMSISLGTIMVDKMRIKSRLRPG